MRRRAFALALILLGASVGPARADWVPDSWITLSTKVALLTHQTTRGAEINVDTIEGRVTLHGKVPSLTARERAEKVALAIRGVHEVQNLLQVVPPHQIERVERSDAWIERKTGARLRRAGLSPDTRISVKSVNKGLVLLAGSTSSQADHLAAIQVARDVPGVRAVASEVRIVEHDVAHLLDGYEFGDGGRSPGRAAADLWVTAQVKLALLAEPGVPALDVSVDTVDGRVTLFGIVPSKESRKTALRAARAVRGARLVYDHLQIVERERRQDVLRQDDELAREVRRHLYARRPLERAVVRVIVRNGVVRLTGTVPSEQHRLLAATTAREVDGVRAVEQDLTVRSITRPNETSSS